jgi:hypothetical protein
LKLQDIVSRKVLAIDLIVVLASRQEFQACKLHFAPAPQVLVKKEPDPEPFLQPYNFPLVCQKTQYIICIRNKQLLYKEQIRAFQHILYMMDHVENLHLSKQPADQKIICHYPIYKAERLVLNYMIYFKHHVATVYRISLRPEVFPS